MLNFIWIAFILVGLLAALAQALQGDLEIFSRVLTGLFDSAKTGFDISIGLVGVMSLWLGIMKVGERGGIVVDAHMRTTVPNVYAAGDVVRGLNQIAVATAEAAVAATDIHNRLRQADGLTVAD